LFAPRSNWRLFRTKQQMEANMTAGHEIQTVRIARTQKADTIPSPRRMVGLITAGAAALSLILATTLPARADNRSDDLAKALIAALVVGAIIHETKKSDHNPAPAPTPEPVHKRKKWKHYNTTTIPAVCALQFDGERRSVTVYPERCLLREGVTRRLPRGCANEARIYGKWDRIYSERCLRDAGFILEDGHDGHDYSAFGPLGARRGAATLIAMRCDWGEGTSSLRPFFMSANLIQIIEREVSLH
jgi:hypothetical protein